MVGETGARRLEGTFFSGRITKCIQIKAAAAFKFPVFLPAVGLHRHTVPTLSVT